MEANVDNGEQEELYRLMRSCGHILYHSGSSKSGQGRIMHLLDENGPMSQKELQTTMNVQSGSISEILTKLEREGLIARSRDENDRRRVIVALTEKGLEHAREYHSRSRRKDWFAALDEAQRQELQTLLQLLLDSWQQAL